MTRRRLARSLLLASVVVIAGCGGLTASDRVVETTLTPAPVPTAGTAFPPGIGESTVSPAVLADAHDRRLRAGGFTLVSRQRVVGHGGTLQRTRHERRVAAGGDTYVGQFTQSVPKYPLIGFPPLELAYWTNGTVTAYHRETARAPRSYAVSRGEPPTSDVTRSRALERLLGAVETTVRERETGVVLVGSVLRRPEAFPTPLNLRRPRNVSLTVRVDDAGVATDWQLAYDATVANRSVRVVRTVRITEVGDTAVERPDWVATAADSGWAGEARATGDDR